MFLDRIVEALAEVIIRERGLLSEAEAQPFKDASARFVGGQCTRLPDYLRLPFRFLILVFGLWPLMYSGRPFHLLSQEKRVRQVRAWRSSRLGFRRDFMKFFDSFVVFAWYSKRYAHAS